MKKLILRLKSFATTSYEACLNLINRVYFNTLKLFLSLDKKHITEFAVHMFNETIHFFYSGSLPVIASIIIAVILCLIALYFLKK